MASTYAGTGTLLKVGDGASPEVFTTIAQILSVDGINSSATVIDTTTHNAAASNRSKTKVAGLIDRGTVSVDVAFDPAESTHKNTSGGLLYLFNQGTVVNWQLCLPAAISPAQKWTFSAFVSSFQQMTPLDDKLTAKITLAISGTATLA